MALFNTFACSNTLVAPHPHTTQTTHGFPHRYHGPPRRPAPHILRLGSPPQRYFNPQCEVSNELTQHRVDPHGGEGTKYNERERAMEKDFIAKREAELAKKKAEDAKKAAAKKDVRGHCITDQHHG